MFGDAGENVGEPCTFTALSLTCAIPLPIIFVVLVVPAFFAPLPDFLAAVPDFFAPLPDFLAPLPDFLATFFVPILREDFAAGFEESFLGAAVAVDKDITPTPGSMLSEPGRAEIL